SHSKQTVDYKTLTKGEKLVKVIDGNGVSTPASQWKIAGTSIPKVNGRAFVTGRHQFASDLKRPRMWYGKILRPPSFNAQLLSIGTQRAEAIGGVVVVHDGNFVGAAAPNEGLAAQALQVIQAEWKSPAQPSARQLFDYLKQNPAEARERTIIH